MIRRIELRFTARRLRASLVMRGRLPSTPDFLLQDDTVDAGLEQGEDEGGLALELAQAIEDRRRRRGRQRRE